mmetsp:Transcript_8210/g.27272  ORF Transcript_8210/g.27272 Transcript_8210/m.27272 type:complete len:95 (-) Transcript_8210:651-935(-)
MMSEYLAITVTPVYLIVMNVSFDDGPPPSWFVLALNALLQLAIQIVADIIDIYHDVRFHGVPHIIGWRMEKSFFLKLSAFIGIAAAVSTFGLVK